MASLSVARAYQRDERTAAVAQRPPFRLIWADKVGLAVIGFGFCALGYMWAVAALAAGIVGADNLLRHEIGLGVQVDFTVASSTWLFLRGLDLAFGGPRRRQRISS